MLFYKQNFIEILGILLRIKTQNLYNFYNYKKGRNKID